METLVATNVGMTHGVIGIAKLTIEMLGYEGVGVAARNIQRMSTSRWALKRSLWPPPVCFVDVSMLCRSPRKQQRAVSPVAGFFRNRRQPVVFCC